MQHHLRFLLILLGFIFWHDLTAQENTPMPYLKFTSPRIIDLGEIKHDSLLAIDIRFKNTGDAPLIIKEVIQSCTCTSSKVDKNKYDQGEEGILAMTIDTKGKIGKNVMSVSISANTEQEEYIVRVSMDIVKKTASLHVNKNDELPVDTTSIKRAKEDSTVHIKKVLKSN